MNALDIIRNSMTLSETVLNAYIGDLDDADLLIRPVAGMNHIAWQLGHLISSERRLLEMVAPGASPSLPDGFDEAHGREAHTVDDPTKFLPRDRYQELRAAQRQATLKVLESLSESDLDRTDPERFPPFTPTVGAVFNLIGTHGLMHCGQFVAVRRSLGKPVTI